MCINRISIIYVYIIYLITFHNFRVNVSLLCATAMGWFLIERMARMLYLVHPSRSTFRHIEEVPEYVQEVPLLLTFASY